MSELYDIASQAAFQKDLLAPLPFEGVYYFIYPPFTALLCVPFAFGNYLSGLFLWWGAGLVALFLSVYLLRGELLAFRRYSTRRLFLMSFLFFPTMVWILYGQNTSLTLLLYTLTFVMLRRQSHLAAGMALGLLLYKPQLFIALGMVLLVKCRWRALIVGLIGAGIWIAIGFAIGPPVMKQYVHLIPSLLALQRSHDLVPLWGNHSFFGFSALLLDGFWKRGGDIFSLLLTAAGIIVVAILWWRTPWKPRTRAWDMKLAATFALGLLISPHLYLYDLMLLLLPIAIVWSYYPSGTEGRALDGGHLLVWTALLYAVCFFGSYLTLAELRISSLIGLPSMALQLSVPILIGWVIVIISLSTKSSLAAEG